MHNMVDVIMVGVAAGVGAAIVTCVVGGAWLMQWVVGVARRRKLRQRPEGAQEHAVIVDT